jgi:hypothetical protein
MTAALICARGGSKRLPRKNVKLFCGHPLFAWAIIQARESHLIDAVYVSTDDDEIADITNQYGAQVIRRPDWPDANEAAACRPMVHGIRQIMREHGTDFDTVLTILPTNPLNLPGDFDNGIRMYRSIGADCIRPLRPMREMVLLKDLGRNRAHTMLFDKRYGYLGEAGFWIVTSPAWYLWYQDTDESDLDKDMDREAAKSDQAGTTLYYFPSEPWQWVDVDTLVEFEMGELAMEKFILKGRGPMVYQEYGATKQKSASVLARFAGNLNQQ